MNGLEISPTRPDSDAERTRPAVAPRRPVYRGIVVVHGIGNQKRGEQLEGMTEPLVDFLGSSLQYDRVAVVQDTIGVDGVSSAEIHLYDRERPSEPAEIWIVREAWWAQTFYPSATSAVLTWGVAALLFHIHTTVVRGFVNPALYLLAGRSAPASEQQGIWRETSHPEPGPFFVRLPDWLTSRAVAAAQVFNWLINTALQFLLYSVGFLPALILTILLQIPGATRLPRIGSFLRSLANFLTGGVGDQQAMTMRSMPLAAAATTVTHALEPFLSPQSGWSTEHGESLAREDFSTVTVVAHSCGCVVSYEALAGRLVRQWIDADTGRPSRRITWITVGSGLNLAWRMRPRDDPRVATYFHRGIGHYINWLDLYARYDPVPQGAAPADLVCAISGVRFKDQAPYEIMRVANDDWPFSDHTTYWWNHSEVTSRIVEGIADNRLATRSLSGSELREGSVEAGPLTRGVQTHFGEAPRNRWRVVWRRLLVTTTIAVSLCLTLGVGQSAAGLALLTFGAPAFWFGTLGVLALISVAPKGLFPPSDRRSTGGLAAFALIGAIAGWLASLQAWDFWDDAPIVPIGRWLADHPPFNGWLTYLDLFGYHADLTPVRAWITGSLVVLAFVLVVRALWSTRRGLAHWTTDWRRVADQDRSD